MSLKDQPVESTRPVALTTRSQVKPLAIFLKLFSSELRTFIFDSCVANLSKQPRGSRGPQRGATLSEVMRIIAFFIHLCATQAVSLKKALRNTSERIISLAVYERIRPLMTFDQARLFELVNKSFSDNIKASSTHLCFSLC